MEKNKTFSYYNTVKDIKTMYIYYLSFLRLLLSFLFHSNTNKRSLYL